MSIYELIDCGVSVGLLTLEAAQVLHIYIQNNKDPQNEDSLKKVIEEAMEYFKEQNKHKESMIPFSNVNLLYQFIAATEHIYDPSIQNLCNRIMSHEFVSPGVIPQRIMQILSTLSFEDMQKFQIICNMYIGIITNYNNDLGNAPSASKRVMVPFKDTDEHSKKIGICLNDIYELQAIGLIAYNPSGYFITGVTCKHPLIYANGKTFYVLWHHKDELPVGNILLTKAGKCLFNVISECDITDGYDTDIREYMEHYGVAFAEQKMYSVIKANGWFSVVAEKRRIDRSQW